ncbi:hypothetical protein PCE1_002758 [Barthelona sp. PCE]
MQSLKLVLDSWEWEELRKTDEAQFEELQRFLIEAIEEHDTLSFAYEKLEEQVVTLRSSATSTEELQAALAENTQLKSELGTEKKKNEKLVFANSTLERTVDKLKRDAEEKRNQLESEVERLRSQKNVVELTIFDDFSQKLSDIELRLQSFSGVDGLDTLTIEVHNLYDVLMTVADELERLMNEKHIDTRRINDLMTETRELKKSLNISDKSYKSISDEVTVHRRTVLELESRVEDLEKEKKNYETVLESFQNMTPMVTEGDETIQSSPRKRRGPKKNRNGRIFSNYRQSDSASDEKILASVERIMSIMKDNGIEISYKQMENNTYSIENHEVHLFWGKNEKPMVMSTLGKSESLSHWLKRHNLFD